MDDAIVRRAICFIAEAQLFSCDNGRLSGNGGRRQHRRSRNSIAAGAGATASDIQQWQPAEMTAQRPEERSRTTSARYRSAQRGLASSATSLAIDRRQFAGLTQATRDESLAINALITANAEAPIALDMASHIRNAKSLGVLFEIRNGGARWR